MNILFLVTKNDTGGAQKYVADLAAHLPKDTFRTEIVTGGKGGIHFLSNAFRPYFFFLNDIAAVIEIVFYLRKHHPDILHLNSSKAGVVGAIAAKLYNLTRHLSSVTRHPLRVIFPAHGWVFNPENRYGWLRQRCYILFHKFAALFQDAIVNVSEYDRQLALRYRIAPANKLFTIHNGIDIATLDMLPKDMARASLTAKRSTLNAQEFWVGSIGRLVAEKNYETLIDAAAKLNDPSVAFFIIGEGYERKKLETLIKMRGLKNNFFLLGTMPDATCYLKAFDVFVMPSIKEGLPYTLLEAMAAGLSIIATRTGGMPEILEPQNGVIIPPRDSIGLANTIQKLLADASLQQTLGANAKAYAQKELTLERMVRETAAIYMSFRA